MIFCSGNCSFYVVFCWQILDRTRPSFLCLYIVVFVVHGILFFQQGKKVKSISGFSGRGFKFDETEEAMAKERKQIQKAALGLNDSDEDEPAQNVSIV